MCTDNTADDEPITIIVNGDPVGVDASTTGTELKQRMGVPEDAMLFYRKGTFTMRLLDKEQVLDHIEAGQEVTYRSGPPERRKPD